MVPTNREDALVVLPGRASEVDDMILERWTFGRRRQATWR